MSSYKNDRSRYLLLAKIFVIVSVIGAGMLIYASVGDDPSHLAFSLIAFVISVAALIMTTLQNLSISRQVRMTERAARLVHETAEQLELLVKEDRRLEREIREDIKLDRAIIAVLEDHGIGDDDAQRHSVAEKITSKLKEVAK